MKPLQVFILPSRNKNNRYIDLLISSLNERDDVEVFPLKKDTLFEVFRQVLLGKGRLRQGVVHVQWSTVLYGSRYALKSILLMVANLLIVCILKVFFGFRFVWTVHNFYAHDYPHPWIDTLGRNFLQIISDCIVVQEKRMLAEYRKFFPKKRIEFVPHGNFIDAFGPYMQTDEHLRSDLGFAGSDIVLGSFGAIAPYKMNEKIIDALAKARSKNSNLKLLISGKGSESYVEKLSAYASLCAGSDVKIRNQFIPDPELSRFLSAVDYSIFYYDKSEMTSGGIILSLSYGVPVITRNIPASEVIDTKNGFVFETDSELVDILSRLTKPRAVFNPHDIMGNITHQTWQINAERLTQIYGTLG